VQHVKREMEKVKESFRRIHTLHHSHICPVYLLGEDPRFGYFVVMKFVEGVTLDEYRFKHTGKRRHLSVNEVVKILWPIAKALDYAHSKHIIHRDIKPHNIMLSEIEGPQLIDFGLAVEIQESMMEVTGQVPRQEVSGTYAYMAPEQWLGRTQDAKTDQYALAATAYTLLTGHHVFQGKNAIILRECVLNAPVPEITTLPEHVNAALARGLAKAGRSGSSIAAPSFGHSRRPKPRTKTAKQTAGRRAWTSSSIARSIRSKNRRII